MAGTRVLNRKDWKLRSLPIVIDWEGSQRVVSSEVPRYVKDESLALNEDGSISFMARFMANRVTQRVGGRAVQKEDGKWYQLV